MLQLMNLSLWENTKGTFPCCSKLMKGSFFEWLDILEAFSQLFT